MTVRQLPYRLFLLIFLGLGGLSQPVDSAAQTSASAIVPDLELGLDLKSANDVQSRFDQVPPNALIETRARAIAEVDDWMFAASAEDAANRLITKQIGMLREQIEGEVASLTRAAIEAPNGTAAVERLTRIDRLLQLYPIPKDDAQRAKLMKMVGVVQVTSRRVEDIRRLRYNWWAVTQIEIGIWNYNEVRRVSDITKIGRSNDEAVMFACVNAIKEVDPSFLEPATLDLYNYYLGLTRDALSQSYKIALVKWLSNPATIRKTARDF